MLLFFFFCFSVFADVFVLVTCGFLAMTLLWGWPRILSHWTHTLMFFNINNLPKNTKKLNLKSSNIGSQKNCSSHLWLLIDSQIWACVASRCKTYLWSLCVRDDCFCWVDGGFLDIILWSLKKGRSSDSYTCQTLSLGSIPLWFVCVGVSEFCKYTC